MQIGFPGLLCLIFVVAKLAGWITWSWLWVLSPIWISFLLFIVVAFLFVGIPFIVALSR